MILGTPPLLFLCLMPTLSPPLPPPPCIHDSTVLHSLHTEQLEVIFSTD